MPASDKSATTSWSRTPAKASARMTSPGTAAEMVERHGDLVYRLAVRLTGDREEARDLAQDAFVRILKGAGSFRGEASEKTWICQVVINCHRNRSRWWRRLKRGRTVSLDETPPGADPDDEGQTRGAAIADPGPAPDAIAEAGEACRRLQTEMGRLPRDQQTALVLREIEGLSYAEIAAAQGVSCGTVKSRIARARETLRRALSGPEAVKRGGTA